MGLFKSDPPQPPNPIDTARAATGTNISTAIANAQLQNINQNTPAGSLRYDTTGNYEWVDPSTGQKYQIPTFTATQNLTERGRNTFEEQQQAQYQLARMADVQSDKISNFLSSPMDASFDASSYLAANPDLGKYYASRGLNPLDYAKEQYYNSGAAEGRAYPSLRGDATKISGIPAAATSFDRGGPVPGSTDAGAITRTYGPQDNYSADRLRVEDALMQRMNPQLQVEQQRVQQQLADQGIRYGSQAYTDAMRNYSQQANDARWGAIQQGGAEQQRMNQMAAQLAAFQNEAQQQSYGQQIGTQAAQFNQNAQAAQFGNLGLAQQLQQQQAAFNAAQAARGTYMQEQYAQRNQPLNEISALLSGSQVQQPNFINTPGGQIPTTDVAGLINQNFAQQFGNFTQQNQQQQALLGGVLGLGAGAMKMSDEREKKNIKKMATVFAADPEGESHELPIYKYAYKKDPASTQHIGPMAQDVERIEPGAVEEHEGRKFIKPRVVMGSIMRAG